MITLDAIIDAMNNIVDGTLVLHRSMRAHPTIKVYKRFCYNIYLIKGNSKELIWSWEDVKNTPSDEIESTWVTEDFIYLNKLIEWISNEDFKKLKKC